VVHIKNFLVKFRSLSSVCVQCGNTALHGAAWNGFSRTVNVLLCNDANVNAVNKVLIETHDIALCCCAAAIDQWSRRLTLTEKPEVIFRL